MEIVAKNVVKEISGVNILNNLSMKVNDGEIYGLVGPNGAGKTTFIRSLLGIYEISSGLIEIDGIKPSDKNFIKIKYKIGCVMDHLGIYKDLSAWENLEFFHRIYFPHANKNSKKSDIETLLKKVEIFHKKDEKPTFFSKGQKQRLALARALINRPKLLILDEPTIGLDVDGTIMFRETIQMIKEEGTTILMSSHNLNELQKICNRYGFVKNGKVIEEASLNELKSKYSNNQDKTSNIETIYKKIFKI